MSILFMKQINELKSSITYDHGNVFLTFLITTVSLFQFGSYMVSNFKFRIFIIFSTLKSIYMFDDMYWCNY